MARKACKAATRTHRTLNTHRLTADSALWSGPDYGVGDAVKDDFANCCLLQKALIVCKGNIRSR